MPVTAYPFLQPCMNPWMHLVQGTSPARRRRRTPPHTPPASRRSADPRQVYRCGLTKPTTSPHAVLLVERRPSTAIGVARTQTERRRQLFFTSRLSSPRLLRSAGLPRTLRVMRPGTPCGDGNAEPGTGEEQLRFVTVSMP